MKHISLIPAFALGTTALAALTLTGCGAGQSNNVPASPTNSTTTTTTTTTSEIVYVADAGYESFIRKSSKAAVKHDGPYNGPALEAYSISITSSGSTVTPLSAVPTYPGLSSIAIDPTHHYLFALTAPDDDEVDVYPLNSHGSIGSRVTTGIIQTGGVAGNTHALTVASPAGAGGADYVYVAGNEAGTIHGFKLSGGSLSSLSLTASPSDTPYTLATDPTGSYLYSGGASGDPFITPYTIAPSTGLITPITQAAAGTAGGVIVVSNPSGLPYVYGYDQGAGILYAYQRSASGTLTLDGSYAHTSAPGNDLAITLNGSAVFLSNGTAGTITEATINSNGSLNTPTTTAALSNTNFVGIAVDANGSFVGSVDEFNDAAVVYPLSGTTLGTPQSTPLDSTINPIAVIFEQSSSAVAGVQK